MWQLRMNRVIIYSYFTSSLFVADEKAAIRAEKDNARMAEVFLELDDDGDGL